MKDELIISNPPLFFPTLKSERGWRGDEEWRNENGKLSMVRMEGPIYMQ